MTVEVYPLNILGGAAGAGPVTFFSDPFTEAAAAGALSQQWATGTIPITPVVNNVYVPVPIIGALADTVNGLIVSYLGSGAVGTVPFGWAAPIPILNNTVYGKSQFCQMTLAEDTTGAGNQIGWGGFLKPSQQIVGYFFQMNRQAGFFLIQKFSPNSPNPPGTSTTISTLLNIAIDPTVGGIVRTSIDIDSNPGHAIITVKYNGVQKGQVTDNTPLSGGWPAINFSGGGTGHFGLRNFSCGLGL